MDIHDKLYEMVSDEKPLLYELWEPNDIAVVLGYSQKAIDEVNIVNCITDHIPILKRRGGGGAVVLMPGILCITISFKSNAHFSPYYFFKKINLFIIKLLEEQYLIPQLFFKGISDITINNAKILGCSIFKSRNKFHYQGSLLVNPELTKIAKYLRHPTKEPDYRAGREHTDFVTSVHARGYDIPLDELKNTLDKAILTELAGILDVYKS